MTTLLLSLTLLSADIPDLGVISPRRAVSLAHHTLRPDFVSFRVEFAPRTPPTNLVTLTVTNILTVLDLSAVPSGPGVIGIRSIYADGEESDVALYHYDLRRGKPPKPSATPLAVLTPSDPSNTLTGEMAAIKRRRNEPMHPPIPDFFHNTNTVIRVTGPTFTLNGSPQWPVGSLTPWTSPPPLPDALTPWTSPPPLPDATNRAYADYLDEESDRASKGKRRSE